MCQLNSVPARIDNKWNTQRSGFPAWVTFRLDFGPAPAAIMTLCWWLKLGQSCRPNASASEACSYVNTERLYFAADFVQTFSGGGAQRVIVTAPPRANALPAPP
ncbi:hypothetical protein PYCC9005_004271 [Savitreella phatthalungensis]